MFDTPLFASPMTLLLGALTGLVFGFLLQRGGLTRFETIVGQFRLKDHTVLKVMGTAILVGGLGIWSMQGLGMIDLKIKSSHLLGQATGGLIFGAGMAILGYCPGTIFAAMGSGARGLLPGILGMGAGAALYAEHHGFWKSTLLEPLSFGKVSMDGVLGMPGLFWIGLLAVPLVALFVWIERRERGATSPPDRPAAGAGRMATEEA